MNKITTEKNKKGKIEIITGCMFSGKSEELIRRLKRFQIAKLNTIVFKPLIDNRYSTNDIVSHNGLKFTAIPVNNSSIILLDTLDSDYDVVAIDEAQFFDLQIIEVVKKIADNGKKVIIAGLDMDFRGEPFGPMPFLMAISDEILKLKAVCNVCGEDATLTQRLINGKPANYNDPIILVGGKESYEARCKEHHIVPNIPTKKDYLNMRITKSKTITILEDILNEWENDSKDVTKKIIDDLSLPINSKIEEIIKERWRQYFYAEKIIFSQNLKKINKKGGDK